MQDFFPKNSAYIRIYSIFLEKGCIFFLFVCCRLAPLSKYTDFKRNQLHVNHDHVITDVAKALDFITSRKYDVIYIGADTLLELDRLPKGYDGISAYWLKDVKAKKILIAASSKNVDFDQLSERQKEDLKIAANQFSHIGLRDKATLNLFERLLGNDNRIKYVPEHKS